MRELSSVSWVTWRVAILGSLGMLDACGGRVAQTGRENVEPGASAVNSNGGAGSSGTSGPAAAGSRGAWTGSTAGTGTGVPAQVGTMTGNTTTGTVPGVATGTATGTTTGNTTTGTMPAAVTYLPGGVERQSGQVCAPYVPIAGPTPGLPSPDVDAGADANIECYSDADCQGDGLGACDIPDRYGPYTYDTTSHCIYDQCETDADCGNGMACDCTTPVAVCLPATCRGSEDCDPGALCLRTAFNTGCSVSVEFHCQTPEDECAANADCFNSDVGGTCGYLEGRHACEQTGCDIGRPFLIAGEHRTATARAGNGWCAVTSVTRTVTPELRRQLAAHWKQVALMEHASVAAFARFTLQLLSLGAPARLVAASNQAAMDETLHARLAFSLASQYAGTSIEPGTLSMDGALTGCSIEEIVINTVLEGCIGETVAAAEADLCAKTATDPAVRDVLTKITADETRHSELAWQFVQWAVSARPELAARVLVLVERETRNATAPCEVSDADAALLAHGVLTDAGRQNLRASLLHEVIAPCMRTLCGAERLAA